MKGLYVARLDLDAPHMLGVARKIADQRAALRTAGLDTELLCLRGGALSLGSQTGAVSGSFERRWTHHVRFHKALRAAAAQADFLYIRFQGAPPDFISCIRHLHRTQPGLPILIEFPSWPFHTERKGWRQRATGMLQDYGLGQLAKYVDRIVTFSQQDTILGVSTLRTDNGVAVADLPVNPLPPDDEPLKLVGVANLSFWHGYDRVIAGLARHAKAGNLPPVVFDIAGGGAEFQNLKAQVETHGLQSNVRLLGPVHGPDLDDLLRTAHIGISSIGMHRLDVDTSNIKSREFCARGLPFCIGYPDRDFPKELGFVHQVSATDDPVDIGALVAWYKALRSTEPNYPDLMRRHAETHLTWDAKMAPVVEWLRSGHRA